MLNILLGLISLFQTSIYTIHFTIAAGADQSMAAYQGKKILLVNIATGSRWVSQLAALQQLQNQYSGSLVVIAFPSNSFGNEPKTSQEVQQFCTTNYNTTFPVAAKNAVTGPTKQALYNWLSTKTQNGVLDGEVAGDFQKYLIDESGNLVGTFSSAVSPTDAKITAAINTDYQ